MLFDTPQIYRLSRKVVRARACQAFDLGPHTALSPYGEYRDNQSCRRNSDKNHIYPRPRQRGVSSGLWARYSVPPPTKLSKLPCSHQTTPLTSKYEGGIVIILGLW
jgi:hypothetical protein